MTGDEFRKLCSARPFRQFTVCLADGQQVRVWHHDFVMVCLVSVSDESRVLELVRIAFCESDGEGFDRLVDKRAHHGRDG